MRNNKRNVRIPVASASGRVTRRSTNRRIGGLRQAREEVILPHITRSTLGRQFRNGKR